MTTFTWDGRQRGSHERPRAPSSGESLLTPSMNKQSSLVVGTLVSSSEKHAETPL